MKLNVSLEDLKKQMAEINAQMESLEAKEPENEDSPEYEKWCQDCEALAMKSEETMTLIDIAMSHDLSHCEAM